MYTVGDTVHATLVCVCVCVCVCDVYCVAWQHAGVPAGTRDGLVRRGRDPGLHGGGHTGQLRGLDGEDAGEECHIRDRTSLAQLAKGGEGGIMWSAEAWV